MIGARHYVSELKVRLAASATIVTVEAVVERVSIDRGYFRARLTLANGDFLEVSDWSPRYDLESGLRQAGWIRDARTWALCRLHEDIRYAT